MTSLNSATARALACALLASVLAVFAGPASRAHAHAEFVGSAPANGQVLEALPAEVRAWFTEAVSPLGDGLEVWSPSGARIDDGKATGGANDRSIQTALLPSAEQGTYTVAWSVISSDGHPIRGSFRFSVGAPSESAAPDVTSASPQWVSLAGGVSRAMAYGLGLLAIGASALAWASRRSGDSITSRLRNLGRISAVLLLFATGAVLACEMLAITAGDIGALLDAPTREAATQARHIPAAALLAAGAAVTASVPDLPRHTRSTAGLLGSFLIASGFAWAGHPAAEPASATWVALDALHVLAAGAWAGGLASLMLVGLRGSSPPGTLETLATRFSRAATVAMPITIVAGLVLAMQIGPGLDGMLGADWGRLLLAKVAFVAAAVVLAGVNRQRTLPALNRGGASALRAFRRLVTVECLSLVVVVAITAVLVGQPPSADRSAGAADSPAVVLDGTIGPYHFVFGLSPAATGANSIAIDFHILGDQADAPPDSVRLRAEHERGGVPAVDVSLDAEGPGRFTGTGVTFAAAGNWAVTMNVAISGADVATLTIPVVIAPGND